MIGKFDLIKILENIIVLYYCLKTGEINMLREIFTRPAALYKAFIDTNILTPGIRPFNKQQLQTAAAWWTNYQTPILQYESHSRLYNFNHDLMRDVARHKRTFHETIIIKIMLGFPPSLSGKITMKSLKSRWVIVLTAPTKRLKKYAKS